LTTFVIADPQFIKDASEMLGAHDITILGFLSPSLGESLLVLSVEERDRGALLIDVGYLNTELSVIEGDAIVYHAILPRGGGHITADLAMGLSIPMRAAEQIKRNYVFNPDEFDMDSFSEVFDETGRRKTIPRKVVSEIVEKSFRELADMIEMTIANDAEQYMGKRSQIYLTGGGLALMRGAKEALAAVIGRPVKISAAKSSKLNSPVYASALGLADLIFDSIESQSEPEENLGSKIRNMFSRNN
ncbi:MAG: cell division FtsA domain-containing protein, partial [bacterium]